ncbi:MAG: aldo/keto reductase [Lachnospiraceae bacterium]|nr:aldo/keto reductase [Lachnospiraceae bacterium]
MNYRRLGKTGLMVSEVGFGGEWLERHEKEEAADLIRYAAAQGINIIDCWNPNPENRDRAGAGIAGNREHWILQGHIGATWQNGQYVRTRDIGHVKPALEDQLARLGTDYIDLGMIHYVDDPADWEACRTGAYADYVAELHESGVIRHIGLSTHNPRIAKRAIEEGAVEMILFSINPAFDMKPATENIETMFEGYDEALSGIDPERAELYRLCEEHDIGITVMKGFFGGRLFDAEKSPFGVTFTAPQLIHYALTRPAVCAVMCGYDTKEQVDAAAAYETASEEERDYASVIAGAPLHSYKGQCTYCGHCAPCPVNIDIAMVNKFYDLAAAQPEVPASVRAHYEALGATASDCIGCRGCESRCPFGVEVSERMKQTAELFGR